MAYIYMLRSAKNSACFLSSHVKTATTLHHFQLSCSLIRGSGALTDLRSAEMDPKHPTALWIWS
jgi:hypothetical protein